MQKIIIDTDPGIDDALAILLALAAKDELDVLALTTVNGNVGVEQVTKNAFKILEIAGRTDIPVYMGNGKPLIGSAILLGGKLIDIKKLMIVLEKKGMSSSVTYVLLSTTNIIPQMSKKMGAILEAQKSRGIETDSNMIVRAKAFFPSVGPLLLNSLVNAEERAITLEARAFSAPCKKTSLKNVEDSSRDKMLRIVFIAATILAIGGKIVLWIV